MCPAKVSLSDAAPQTGLLEMCPRLRVDLRVRVWPVLVRAAGSIRQKACFVLIDQTSVLENCDESHAFDPAFCVKCVDGHYFDAESGKCEVLQSGIANCARHASSGSACLRCEKSYFLTLDRKLCVLHEPSKGLSVSSNSALKSLNSAIPSGNIFDGMFEDQVDSDCEDLVQVGANGRCNFCIAGYHMDPAGECVPNPTENCWVESIPSYQNFGDVFASSSAPLALSKALSQDTFAKGAVKSMLLSRVAGDGQSEEAVQRGARMLSENEAQSKGPDCFVCKPGYYQNSSGSCIRA